MKENGYSRLMNWFEMGCDLVLLNLLWLSLCLPVITVGASTTAMHYVVRKMIAGEPYKVAGSFFHSFRENWKQATALWLMLVFLIAIGLGDFYIGSRIPSWIGTASQLIAAFVALGVLVLTAMAFPLLARYQASLGRLLKNAVLLGLTNPFAPFAFGATLAILPAVAIWKPTLLGYIIPVGLLIGGVIPTLAVEILLRPVCAKLEKN